MADGSQIGIIGGGGWLGGAIARGILDAALVPAADLTLSYRSREPDGFAGVHLTSGNEELIERSDIVIVSVRPADWPALVLSAPGRLVISVMAGIGIAEIQSQLRTRRVVRTLPNAAAEVGCSYTPWRAADEVTAADRAWVRAIFEACGSADEVADESQIDYLTGLSGGGPAFPALLADAMQKDAVARGIDPSVARRAVTAVLVGTGRMFAAKPEDPAEVVETFVGYRGTTAAAIAAMRAAGLERAVSAGLGAALEKSQAMGRAAS